ncbi:MAG: restriction endonuclease subunit S [Methanosarcina sp.]|nr:restriction endonuclease subunit S [Methanosarcina sp.]MDD3317812.1 restriction endonuclease subunit S [Methanosarcina sp.]MDD4306282.1 restriction endonuclease subunit S [Methanosarcina sp.]MDD4620701.1 restriction endonuclease subunit S [Methanosarcina sp.]
MKEKVGWIKGILSDFGEVVSGGTPKTKVTEYWGEDISWITPADLSGYSEKYIHKGKRSITHLGLKNSSAKLMPKGSVLFSSRAPIGYVAIAGRELCTNQGFKSLVPSKTVKSDFLYYYFKSIKPLAEKRASGTTFKELSGKAFADLPLCLPPLPEQRAIVSKIEQIFSKLDNGISNFKLAQEQLKVYRQAVLKKAFEGELTKKWREQQTDLSDAGDLLEEIRKERENAAKVSDKRTKKKIIQSPESVYEDNLPEKWCWVRVDSILFESKKGMTTGPFGTALKKHEHQKSGIPVYGIENIGEGVFRKPNKIFITEEKAKELQAFEVKPYDIIISRSGTVGEICSIPENIAGGIISTNLIRVRLDLRIISTKYFVYLFQGGNVREQVKELCKGSTRAFLNQTILSSINFPLCSLPEQQAIVQEIETRLSVCDKLEQDIAENLEKTEALRQSILKKAFEGKLLNERELTEVRGAEDWEPAEVLLERIKAERASKK